MEHTEQSGSADLSVLEDYLKDHFDNDLNEYIDYFCYCLQVICRNIDRSQEPVVVTNVIDHLFEMQSVLIRSLPPTSTSAPR